MHQNLIFIFEDGIGACTVIDELNRQAYGTLSAHGREQFNSSVIGGYALLP